MTITPLLMFQIEVVSNCCLHSCVELCTKPGTAFALIATPETWKIFFYLTGCIANMYVRCVTHFLRSVILFDTTGAVAPSQKS